MRLPRCLPAFLLGLILIVPIAQGRAETSELGSSAVLVDSSEPGTPLHVTGTVYGSDGKTPLAGVQLYVFHTDDRGYYGEKVMDNQNPRLKATVKTGSDGRYQLETILPGPYPGGGVPAHIHYIASGGGYEQQSFELHFEGDGELGPEEIERSRDLGRFGTIRPVSEDSEGSLHCVHDLRMRD